MTAQRYGKRTGTVHAAVITIAAVLAFQQFKGKPESAVMQTAITQPIVRTETAKTEAPIREETHQPVIERPPQVPQESKKNCPEIPRCGNGVCDPEETRKPEEGKVFCPDDCKPPKTASHKAKPKFGDCDSSVLSVLHEAFRRSVRGHAATLGYDTDVSSGFKIENRVARPENRSLGIKAIKLDIPKDVRCIGTTKANTGGQWGS